MSDPYRSEVKTAGPCPRCHVDMLWNRIFSADIAECQQCQGVFVHMNTLRTLIAEKPNHIAELLMVKFSSHADLPNIATQRPMYIKCPSCATLMTRTQFAKGAKVVVDICTQCGVWFDVGEFGAVVDFIMHGGLERSAQRIADETARNSKAQSTGGAAITSVRVTNRFTKTAEVQRTPLAPLQTAAVWSMFELLVKPTGK
jgi:Zn-finger nucleic acid-binding protein